MVYYFYILQILTGFGGNHVKFLKLELHSKQISGNIIFWARRESRC